MITLSSSCSAFDARIDLVCGQTRLYGGPSRGCLECGAARPTCADPNDEWPSGDAVLRLDRAARTVRVEGRVGDMAVDNEIDPPPRPEPTFADGR